MSRLAPNLFDRRFGDLVEQGRSYLPSLAPKWTDHNAHDPGIMLMELLAWVAEAQIYSLARTRRDERAAYAALMGIVSHGTRPARGLIWPDHDDPDSPAGMISRHFIIECDIAIHTANSETPIFRPAHRILWIPARIRALTTRLANGPLINHTGINQCGGSVFYPFGETAGHNDVLRMELEATGNTPLFTSERPDDAYFVIGVRAGTMRGNAITENEPAIAQFDSPLEVRLTAGGESFPLRIVQDSSGGFMHTGACVLDLSGVQTSSRLITLEFRASRGFDRPPRILRVEPNVVPIIQGQSIERELHIGQGLPEQGFDLETPSLMFEPSSAPLKVEIAESGSFDEWKQCARLSDHGPNDRVYEFDPGSSRVTFGNGLNGRMPTAGAQIFVSYSVSEGLRGNMARNRKWLIHGVRGVFGVNPDPVTGGQDSDSWLEQRRRARRIAKEGHALVTPSDIETAALALPTLDVARAWVPPPGVRAIETGTVTLIAMQARHRGMEPLANPETPRWLEAIQRQLLPRMPLGSRLVVAGPSYVDFNLHARVESEPGRDPASVKKAIEDELDRRLLLVGDGARMARRPFGLPVTCRDFATWIQSLPDVRRVLELQILLANRKTVDEVKVPRHGLPRIDLKQSTIEVVRAAPGASR